MQNHNTHAKYIIYISAQRVRRI